MKTILSLMAIMALGLGVSAQKKDPFGNPISKEDRKAEKAAEKAAKNAADAERKRITVNFTELARFPDSYVGGVRRLARIGLVDVQPVRDGDQVMYLFRLNSGYDYSTTAVLPGEVMFAMDEPFAKSVLREMLKIKDQDVYSRDRTLIGDVYFELKSLDEGGRRFYAAKVTCVAFIGGFLTSVLSQVGDCPLVK